MTGEHRATGPARTGPLVSIAIPTYNRADSYLADCVAAALAQTWEHVEVLVGDNASTDDTPALMERLSDPRLRYIRREENIGANGNFNALLNEARGDWFVLLHDDDLIDADFVESCLGAMPPDTECGFVRTGTRIIDAEGRVVKERPSELSGFSREDFYLSWFNSRTGSYLCATLYNTERLRSIGGFHSVHALLEDNVALVKLLGSWSYGNVEAVKASFRRSYNQRTYSVPIREWCEEYVHLLGAIEEQVEPSRRDHIRRRGLRFFSKLCTRHANAIASPVKRAAARLVVARYFGPKTLRFSWQSGRRQ